MTLLVQAQIKFTLLVGRLIAAADSQGFGLTFGDAWAKTGHAKNSLHYERLAIDFNLFVNGIWIQTDHSAWHILGPWWKGCDPLCRWGGDIEGLQDYNHYSMVPDAGDKRI
jgi:hypothetical protein